MRSAVLKIQTEGDIELALISQYLSKSKLELGQITYDVHSTDIGKLVVGVSESLQPRAQEQGLTLLVHAKPPTPVLAYADEAKLREVIGNLVDNAIKYTKEGGVDVSIETQDRAVRITVSGTGVGIPPDTLHQLFRKFSRADAQRLNLLGPDSDSTWRRPSSRAWEDGFGRNRTDLKPARGLLSNYERHNCRMTDDAGRPIGITIVVAVCRPSPLRRALRHREKSADAARIARSGSAIRCHCFRRESCRSWG